MRPFSRMSVSASCRSLSGRRAPVRCLLNWLRVQTLGSEAAVEGFNDSNTGAWWLDVSTTSPHWWTHYKSKSPDTTRPLLLDRGGNLLTLPRRSSTHEANGRGQVDYAQSAWVRSLPPIINVVCPSADLLSDLPIRSPGLAAERRSCIVGGMSRLTMITRLSTFRMTSAYRFFERRPVPWSA